MAQSKNKDWRLSIIRCGDITRALRTVRNLKGKVYVVGGVITEGSTVRDLDIIVNNLDDIPQLKKALGKYAKRAHFMFQKNEPPSPLFLKITGKEPRSAGSFKKEQGKNIPSYEYAGLA